MGGVSSVVQEPDGASAGTVEPRATATYSQRLFIDTLPEVARPKKPEVAPKPVIVRQPSVLAPYSQIWIGEGSRPSAESPEDPDNRSTAAVHRPFHTGTGNRNPDDVTQMSVEDTVLDGGRTERTSRF